MASSALLLVGFLAVIALLACSALFSSAETAIFSLPPVDGEAATAPASSGERTLQGLRADPHRLLVTLLVGNNVVNVAIASTTTALAVAYLPPGVAVAAATAVTSLLVIVFGEVLPKSYGLGNAATWAVRVAPAIRLVEIIFSPVVTVLDAGTRRVNAYLSGDEAIERPYVD